MQCRRHCRACEGDPRDTERDSKHGASRDNRQRRWAHSDRQEDERDDPDSTDTLDRTGGQGVRMACSSTRRRLRDGRLPRRRLDQPQRADLGRPTEASRDDRPRFSLQFRASVPERHAAFCCAFNARTPAGVTLKYRLARPPRSGGGSPNEERTAPARQGGTLAQKASNRPSQFRTTNSRLFHGMSPGARRRSFTLVWSCALSCESASVLMSTWRSRGQAPVSGAARGLDR
jgi:hypothetical protein